MSSISSNLASVLANINAREADPKQDPAAALKRLGLKGKAHEPYVDVIHFGTTDLGAVAREIDAERQRLEDTSSKANRAVEALTKIEELLKEATDLATTNAKGAGRGAKRANQKKIEGLLDQMDEALEAASDAVGGELFSGRTTLSAGDASVAVGEVSRGRLGRLVINGEVLSLADVVRRGRLDTSRQRESAEAAVKVLKDAGGAVKTLREQIASLQDKSVRPRLGDVANAMAGIFSARGADVASSDEALKVAEELRQITLSTSTAAIAVGAEGWDRERVLELLT